MGGDLTSGAGTSAGKSKISDNCKPALLLLMAGKKI